MNKFLLNIAICLIAPAALLFAESESEERTEHETYIWLEREGIHDPEVPDSKVIDLLSKGIKHKDPKIVHCSISAVVMYTSWVSTLQGEGKKPPIERQLGSTPGLYDLFIELWEEGWKKSGGIVPDGQYPEDMDERVQHKTGCTAPDPIWITLAPPMAALFPGDEKVYDIIWKDLPQRGTHSLVRGLWNGKFNNPKDQQYRIELLSNPETDLYTTTLTVRSLGDLPAEKGLETLAPLLETQTLKWGTPELVIVESMMKYEAEAVPYIPLMRETLEKSRGVGRDRELRATLKERLVHFEEKYAEEAELPTP